MTISIVAMAKNEEKNINEWLSYHKKIGFSKVYLYCNDDNPDLLYKTVLPYIEENFVIFRHHIPAGDQNGAYVHWMHLHRNDTEWVTFLDIDEYITLGSHRFIEDAVSDFGWDTECIYINWFNFGSCNYEYQPNGRILQNYNKRMKLMRSITKVILKTSVINLAHVTHNNISIQHGAGNGDLFFYPYCDRILNSVFADKSEFRALYQEDIDDNMSVNCRKSISISHFYIKHNNHFHERAERGRKHYEKTGEIGWLLDWQNKIDSKEYLNEIVIGNEFEDNILKNWSIFMYGEDFFGKFR